MRGRGRGREAGSDRRGGGRPCGSHACAHAQFECDKATQTRMQVRTHARRVDYRQKGRHEDTDTPTPTTTRKARKSLPPSLPPLTHPTRTAPRRRLATAHPQTYTHTPQVCHLRRQRRHGRTQRPNLLPNYPGTRAALSVAAAAPPQCAVAGRLVRRHPHAAPHHRRRRCNRDTTSAVAGEFVVLNPAHKIRISSCEN